jgi:hypothetical protein
MYFVPTETLNWSIVSHQVEFQSVSESLNMFLIISVRSQSRLHCSCLFSIHSPAFRPPPRPPLPLPLPLPLPPPFTAGACSPSLEVELTDTLRRSSEVIPIVSETHSVSLGYASLVRYSYYIPNQYWILNSHSTTSSRFHPSLVQNPRAIEYPGTASRKAVQSYWRQKDTVHHTGTLSLMGHQPINSILY